MSALFLAMVSRCVETGSCPLQDGTFSRILATVATASKLEDDEAVLHTKRGIGVG